MPYKNHDGYVYPPLTADDIARIRRNHTGFDRKIWGPDDDYYVCSGCGQQTCDTQRLLDYIDSLELQLREAKKA